jgi:hypothetical protein
VFHHRVVTVASILAYATFRKDPNICFQIQTHHILSSIHIYEHVLCCVSRTKPLPDISFVLTSSGVAAAVAAEAEEADGAAVAEAVEAAEADAAAA